MITASMTVAEVLRHSPQCLDTLVAQHPAFVRLRRPLLRKTFARLVTIEQAAKIAGVELDGLLAALNSTASGAVIAPQPSLDHGSAASHDAAPASPAADSRAVIRASGPAAPTAALHRDPLSAAVADQLPAQTSTPPAWLEGARIQAEVDARSADERGPLGAIMRAAAQVQPGGILLVRSAFEPLPLFTLLAQRGFAHWSQQHASDDWASYFLRLRAPAAAPAQPAAAPAPALLDNRGLEPPQPMQRTLAALEQLAPGATLTVLTDRQPLFLFEALEEQGYTYATTSAPDGGFQTQISAPKPDKG